MKKSFLFYYLELYSMSCLRSFDHNVKTVKTKFTVCLDRARHTPNGGTVMRVTRHKSENRTPGRWC